MKIFLPVLFAISSSLAHSITCEEAFRYREVKAPSEKSEYYKNLILNLPFPKWSLKENVISLFSRKPVKLEEYAAVVDIPASDVHILLNGRFGDGNINAFISGVEISYYRKNEMGVMDRSKVYKEDIEFSEKGATAPASFLAENKYEIASARIYRLPNKERETYEKFPILTKEKLAAESGDKVIPAVVRRAIVIRGNQNEDGKYFSTAYRGPGDEFWTGYLVKEMGEWKFNSNGYISSLKSIDAIEIRSLPPENIDQMLLGARTFKSLHNDKDGYSSWKVITKTINLETVEMLKRNVDSEWNRVEIRDLSILLKSNKYSPIGVLQVLTAGSGPYANFNADIKNPLRERIGVTTEALTIKYESGDVVIPWSEISAIKLATTIY